MLVVMGIIAMLIALVFPVMRKVRYQASLVGCTNNMRQLGALLSGYAAENMGWYPKNGACRNDPYSLKNGNYWDILTPMQKFIKNPGSDIFRCPLVTTKMIDTKQASSYALFFDTWAMTTTAHGSIADDPTNRPTQYGVNGAVVAGGPPGTFNSVVETTIWAYLDERKLMRRQGQTWTGKTSNTGEVVTFPVIAADRSFCGGSNTNGSRESNHPDPRGAWGDVRLNASGATIQMSYWRGTKNVLPYTSANYLLADGSVVNHTYKNLDYNVYWSTMDKVDNVYSIGLVGFIPRYLRTK
jgi:type II secretory pathway pseudopilin PulG